MTQNSHASARRARPVPVMIGHEIYRVSSYGPFHPLRVPRVSTVMDLARAMGWLDAANFLTSPRAKPAALTGFHTDRYVAALQEAEATQHVTAQVRDQHGLGTPNNPVFPEMYRRPVTSAGGAWLAGELLARTGAVYVPAAGTHHGLPDRANGFCYLNDPVIAIQSLRRNGVQRVAYVDIDAHHPDGVEVAFRDDPDVLMVSCHEENRWPRTGHLDARGLGQMWNLPLPAGVGDDAVDLMLESLILPVVTDFRPDVVVLQCGADAVTEDPQSRLAWSNQAHWAVVAALQGIAPRYLVLGGGGYNPWSVGRCWTGVWATMNGFDVPDRLPSAAEAVLRNLRWEGQRRVAEPPEAWVTTLGDTARHHGIPDALKERLALLRSRMAAWV
ncbi:MAG: acetoin utilization protein AcuC [Pseudomonadota bacterium]